MVDKQATPSMTPQPATEAPSKPPSASAPGSVRPPATSAPLSFLQRVRDDLFRPRPKEAKQKEKEAHKGDTSREIIETIVFVVVLVLMLKAFVAEAFVIPTGSMATTLLGYNRHAHCEKCGFDFPVNASSDAEEFHWFQTGPASSAVCPNCRNIQELSPTIYGGYKVLVLKPQYDFGSPQRWDVIVFKFPGKQQEDAGRDGGPQENFSAKNYIKRLWGLPGEKLAIWHGDVYLVKVGENGKVERTILRKPPTKVMEMRRPVNNNDLQASDLAGTVPSHWADEGEGKGWTQGEDLKTFTLAPTTQEHRLRYRNFLRPPPLPANAFNDIDGALRNMEIALKEAERERYLGVETVVRSERTLVSQVQTLENLTLLPVAAKDHEFHALVGRIGGALRGAEDSLAGMIRADGREDSPQGSENQKESLRKNVGFVRDALKAIVDQWKASLETARQPQLVTDFLGYNAGIGAGEARRKFPREITDDHEPHWVKDLMLDCEVDVTEPGGELTLELNAGVDVHRATFDLSSGACTLKAVRFGEGLKATEIAKKQAATRLQGTGRHHLRFANFDDRLILWVDGSLAFEDGLEFAGPASEERGPRAGDVSPVSIIGRGSGLTVRKLQVWRDIYYTRSAGGPRPWNRPEYENLQLIDRSALGVAYFLGLSAEDQTLPAAAPIERWDGFARQQPLYYPMGVKHEFGREVADPELPNGKPLGADEYFALGDNSTRSSDSRDWGPVPKRLLLGKAVFVYWPIPDGFGLIR